MKVSKKTNRICLGLAIAALVAIFCYQVAYGTNEISYRFGYKTTVNTASCIATQIRTDNGDDCNRGIMSPTWVCGYPNDPDADNALNINPNTGFYTPKIVVTNQTACNDGFYNGFVHWCSTDVKGCVDVLKQQTDVIGFTRSKQ